MDSVSSLTFGNLLRRYRVRLGYTQSELADASGVSIDSIGKAERDLLRRHHAPTLSRLVTALGLTERERQDFLAAGRGLRLADSATSPPDADVVSDGDWGWSGEGVPLSAVSSIGAELARTAPTASREGPRNLDELRDACDRSVKRAIASLPKYAADLYVRRDGLEREMRPFLNGEQPCLAILGEAGMGKTNLLCDLAARWSARIPTVLIRGTTHMAGPLGLWRVLAEELAIGYGHGVDPATLPSFLDHALRSGATDMLIMVDGVNENAHISDLRQSLSYALTDMTGTRMKLCLTCRDVDWPLFEDDAALTRHIYEPRQTGGRTAKGMFVEPFTDAELATAWAKYAAFYGFAGGLGPSLQEICRHPLMLRFLCEAFQYGAIPPGIHRKEIFDRYWREKLHTRQTHDTETAVYRLAGRLFESRRTEITQAEVIDLIGEHQYVDLLSERVILYARRDRLYDQHLVGFTYDAFLEYAIARHLRQTWDWAWRDSAAVASDLRSLLQIASKYRAIQGILVYLLLFVDDTTVPRNFLEYLIDLDAHWRIFVCDYILKVTDPTLLAACLPYLARLGRDDHFPVRWAAANALGYVATLHVPGAEERLRLLASGTDWMDREVAALAAGHLFQEPSRAFGMLESLADDINWRVRRAVGCALDTLCRTAHDACFGLFTAWSRRRAPRDWRLRRAVAQAKYGLLLDLDRAMEVLRVLASDPVDEVRWRVVSDLVAAAWHAEVRHVALGLLRRLARDPEEVVRRHMAFWVPDIVRGGDGGAEIVDLLARDKSVHVRWALARSLGAPEIGRVAAAPMPTLANDYDPRVRFAAYYSANVDLMGTARHPVTESLDTASPPVAVGSDEEQLWTLRERLARSSRVLKRPDEHSDIYSTWKPDRYANIRQVVSEGAEELGTPARIRAFFLLLLEDEDEGIRWALASLLPVALGFTDDGARAEILAGLMRDAHYWVRRESCASLERLARAGMALAPDLIDLVRTLGADRNPEVRLAALHCAAALRDHGAALSDDVFLDRANDDDRQVRGFATSVLNPIDGS